MSFMNCRVYLEFSFRFSQMIYEPVIIGIIPRIVESIKTGSGGKRVLPTLSYLFLRLGNSSSISSAIGSLMKLRAMVCIHDQLDDGDL